LEKYNQSVIKNHRSLNVGSIEVDIS